MQKEIFVTGLTKQLANAEVLERLEAEDVEQIEISTERMGILKARRIPGSSLETPQEETIEGGLY